MRLRPLTHADAAQTLVWRNAEQVRHAMFNTDPVSAKNHTDWIGRVIDDHSKFYYIFETEGDDLGIVGLIFRDRQAGSAEWSFHIGSPLARKGAGGQMLGLALTHFFDDLKGQMLFAEVLEDNAPSLRLHRKLGFQETGLCEQMALHLGVEKNVYQFQMSVDQRHGLASPVEARHDVANADDTDAQKNRD